MPSEAWYLLIACLCGVVGLAIWKGRGITIRRDSLSVEAAREPRPGAGVSVAGGARILESSAGDVTGVRRSDGDAPTPAVDVLRRAEVKGSQLGNITGIDSSGKR